MARFDSNRAQHSSDALLVDVWSDFNEVIS